MRLVEIIRDPSALDRAQLTGFVAEVTDATGTRPLSDHLWLDLQRGDGEGFVAVSIADADRILAMAQISGANDGSALEVVLRPDLPDAAAIAIDAVDTIVDAFARDGGGPLSWWVDEAGQDERALAHRHGLAPVRSLHEMRRALPADRRSSVTTRSFVPGADDDEWLTVNNRAFADHGEQGGWTRDTLALRLAEPWFDPDGFRIHEREGRIAAFCWTKLHHDADPVVGEIYVIAVDPDFHRLGLGRELTLAGLDSISDRGVSEALLYVDAGNEGAVDLYASLGFDIRRTRQAFAGTVAASSR